MNDKNIERKQLPTVNCRQFKRISQSIVKYRKKSNKLLSVRMLRRVSSEYSIQPYILNALAVSHKRSYLNASTELDYLTYYHLLITDQINNPENWQLYPTIDGLSITLDASDKELKRLEQFFDVKNEHPELKIRKYVKSNKGDKSAKGIAKQSYKEENKERNLYKKTVQVHLINEDCEHMRVSLGLKGDKHKHKMRPVRFSFNPARFKGKQLRKLFQQIREANVFDDFNKALSGANVTRVDIAIDLIGVPTPMIIATLGQAVHYSAYPHPNAKDYESKRFAETMYAGNPAKSRLTCYSKVDKQIAKKQLHVVVIIGPDTNPLSIVRVERVYKPLHSGTIFKLSDLAKAPSLLKGVKLYNPLAYTRLGTLADVAHALKRGYPVSQIEENARWSVLMKYFQDEELKPQYRRARNGKYVAEKSSKQVRRLARTKMLKELAPFELPINNEWFEEKQRKLLKKILKLMLNKKRG